MSIGGSTAASVIGRDAGPFQFPPDFRPFPTMLIGENRFENIKVLFESYGNPILLIGQGTYPVVWLWAPYRHGATMVAERNVSHHPSIDIELSARKTGGLLVRSDPQVVRSDPQVTIKFRGLGPLSPSQVCLSVIKQSDDEALISDLDLRTLGVNVYFENSALTVGNLKFEDGKFSNLDVAIRIS